jgi:ubiquitin-protein ligase
MVTPQEARRIRLKNDYREMVNIKGDLIQWKPLKGEPPFVEAYELIIKIKTIIGRQPDYRNEHVINLELPAGYPNDAPQINMQTSPPPFHPNWYRHGNWCFGTWEVSEGLGHHVIRTLQFDPEITNPDSPANTDAKDWYLQKQGSDLFPCDTTNLPDPTQDKITSEVQKNKPIFIVQSQTKKKFNIQS